MNKPDLLMLNMSYQFDWSDGIVNRNYHVLQALIGSGMYNTILSVDFLPYNKRKWLKTVLKGKPWKKNAHTVYRSFRSRVDMVEKNGTTVLSIITTSTKQLDTLLDRLKLNRSNTVIWSYDPFTADYVSTFKKATVVFDAVDNWTEHPSYTKEVDRLQQAYKEVSKSADVIFTVSEGLIDFFGRKEKVLFVPNGVDAEHFAKGVCDHNRVGRPKSNTQRPLVGYHGIIQSRVNMSTIEYVATNMPEVDFVIAGPIWKEMQGEVDALRKLPNLFFQGLVAYSDLPSLISCFDVTIIPHKVDHFTQSMNPLKIYEYLAAGKPIISTAVAGADQFQDLIKLAVSPEDFVQKIRKALNQDTAELRQRRQEMARLHSWGNRIQIMAEAVAEARHGKL